jgi:phosphatidylglycerol:prolipoprotein diacylglycerol transferase
MHPILFKMGFVTVYTYGAMVATAFLISTFLLSFRFKEIGLRAEVAFDLAVQLLVFGIVGARLLHVFLNINYYLANLKEIFMLQHGGLAWQGGFFFAFIGGILFMKRHHLKIGATCDIVIPYVVLGQSIGRIGCYLNGCCYGKPTELAFGVIFPGRMKPVHPTELYLSFFLIIIFLLLKKIEEKKSFDWQIFSLYLIFYSVVRFSIDFLRGDLQAVLFGLTTSQLIGIGIFLSGLCLYIISDKRHKKRLR